MGKRKRPATIRMPFPSGNTLTTSSSQAWLGEVAWNDSAESNGTGGGISTYDIPWWQTNLATEANGASATMRNIPDVACVANELYSIADDGIEYNNEGTSIAAPLWAGFAALINQDEAELGQAPVGFLNPALYALGRTNEAISFHDVTSATTPITPIRPVFIASLATIYALDGALPMGATPSTQSPDCFSCRRKLRA